MTAPGKQVAARIGFAERWLGRARAQCEDGNVAGGLLTLSLADAEVRYALEAGGWQSSAAGRSRTAGTGRRRFSWVAVAAASVALLIWMMRAVPLPAPVSAGPTDGPLVVRLTSHVGTLLAMVAPAAPSAPAPAASFAAAKPARRTAEQSARLTRAPVAAPVQSIAPAVTAVAAPPGVTTTFQAAARPSTVTPPPLISDVDLIEMVLAADRTLRGTSP